MVLQPGIGMTVGSVINHPNFEEQPSTSSFDVWNSRGRDVASNGGIMRVCVVSALDFNDIDKVVERAKESTLVTHYDPRCIASSIAVCLVASQLLQGKSKEEALEFSREKSLHILSDLIDSIPENKTERSVGYDWKKENVLREFENYFNAKELSELHLDEEKTRGYTLKTMASALVCLRNDKTFAENISDILLGKFRIFLSLTC